MTHEELCEATARKYVQIETTARDCEILRLKYLETKNEHYFDVLVHQLPASYKVVKL